MIIVDTSIVLKWINEDEKEHNLALLLYKNHIERKEEIIVPRFLFIEAANALTTKTHSIAKTLKKDLNFIFNTFFVMHEETPEDILESVHLAKKYKTSVYDMLYAVIAKKKNTTLITADARFVEKTKFPFVKTLKEYSL